MPERIAPPPRRCRLRRAGSALSRSRSAASFWDITVSQKEATALHADSSASIADTTAGRECPIRLTRIRRSEAYAGHSWSVCWGGIPVTAAMMASRRRLSPYLIQIITKTTMSGDYLSKSEGDSPTISPQPGFEDRQDSTNNALARVPLICESRAPLFERVPSFLPPDYTYLKQSQLIWQKDSYSMSNTSCSSCAAYSMYVCFYVSWWII